jgi:hypothetical protein
MKRALFAGLTLAMAATTLVQAEPVKAYKAPLNALGQPDLSGFWTNATLTPTIRPSGFGERATYTPAEVKKIEGDLQAGVEKGNAPVDNTKPLTGGVIGARGGTEISGNYDRGWFDPGNNVMRVHGEPRNSILTTPNGQVPPRIGATASPAPGPGSAGQVFAPRRGPLYDNPENLGLGDRCIISFGRNAGPPMLGNGFYNNNYAFVQSRDAVAINTEMVHDTRIIPLHAKHRTDGLRPWFGDSIGWYEGDTLVVETTNIPQRQAYMGAWEKLKVTEKFTRVAKDRVLYQFTVEDPTLWAKPWGGEYEFASLNGRVMEYACHEGNYALEGILAGARQEEKSAVAAARPAAVP